MGPKYAWDEFSRQWTPKDELTRRHIRHVEDRRRAQGQAEYDQFVGAAKRPQELELLDFEPRRQPPLDRLALQGALSGMAL